MGDGPQDHGRLEHPDEQGARGDRGPRAVRRRLRPDRGRRAPAIGRALDGRVHRRFDDRPAEHARHAAADRVRARLPAPHRHRRSVGSTGRRCAGSTSSRPTSTTFRCLAWPTRPGARAATAPAWLSAANEVAVDAFLGRAHLVGQIADVCAAVLDAHDGVDTRYRRRRDRGRRRSPAPSDAAYLDTNQHAHDMHHMTTDTDSPPPAPPPIPTRRRRPPRTLHQRGDGRRIGRREGRRRTRRRLARRRSAWSAWSRSIGVLGLFSIWWLVFVVGVLVAIFLHELGHFVTARWTGMKATQFFIGFGPRLWSFRRGETEYGVRALPLGAFVRIIGMNNMDEVDPADEARTYRVEELPASAAGDLGRLDHAHADRDRVAVHRVRGRRRIGADRRRARSARCIAGSPPVPPPACSADDVVLDDRRHPDRRAGRARRVVAGQRTAGRHARARRRTVTDDALRCSVRARLANTDTRVAVCSASRSSAYQHAEASRRPSSTRSPAAAANAVTDIFPARGR